MDVIDSSNPTNVETKNKWYRKKCWKQICRARPSPNKNTRVITLEKLTAREIYSLMILSSGSTPTSQKYFGKGFPNENLDWNRIYILPRVVTINNFKRNFQYKILHNISYLNKMLFIFGKTKTALCSFCHSYDETIKHIFLEYMRVKQLRSHLRLFLMIVSKIVSLFQY